MDWEFPLTERRYHLKKLSLVFAFAAVSAVAGDWTGTIVDEKCSGNKAMVGNAACSAKCIKGGGPVGIVSDGKAYLIVGDHKPMNDRLAEYAGKTITVKGKMAERGGVAMLENAEIVKK